jgi:membrane protein implicated in regulation of membrane protease activity
MPAWFPDFAWAAWSALAALLIVCELLSLDLVLLMLGVGAAGGAVTALLGGPVPAQVLVALVVSMAMLALVRPNVIRRLHAGPDLRTGHAALVGRRAVVIEPVDANGGRIRLAGELWSARAYDDTSTIRPGATVDVFEIDGATAVVYETSPPES